jgi:hypothetical protein
MFSFKRLVNNMKNKMLFSQREDLQLNADTKITLMKPGQDLYLRYISKIEKVMKIIFKKTEGDISPMPWTDNDEEYNYVNNVIKAILLYTIRSPNDYRKRLLVDNDQSPGADQEYYDDFNPVIDAKILKDQGYYDNEIGENTKIFTPQLSLFFIVLRKSGWYPSLEDSKQEAEDIETFPEKSDGNEEVTDSSTV